MSGEPESNLEFYLIYGGDDGDVLDADNAVVLDPVGQFLLDEELSKSGAVDSSWNERIGIRPRVEPSKEFLARSDARLESVVTKIRALFGTGHEEQTDEAIELAKSMRDAVREEVLEEQ